MTGHDSGGDPTLVLVVGDLMLDRYVSGSVSRISPEAPVPVVDVDEEYDNLGGAANVARQITTLGGQARLLGVLGDDPAGRRAAALCADAGIDASGFVVDPTRSTTTKERIVVERQQIARLDRETATPVDGDVEDRIVTAIRASARPGAVIVSDYAKGVVTDRVLACVVAAAAEWGVPILVDPKHRDLTRYRGATVVKANLAEYEAAVGEVGRSSDDLVDAVVTSMDREGRQLLGAGIEHLVVTLGDHGLVVLSADRPPVVIPTRPSDVFDVSGAGDTVIASLALTAASGVGLVEGAVIANTAAGLAVQHRGVGVVLRRELLSALGVGSRNDGAVDRHGIAHLARAWRSAGRRVVFTNGCFDLFHAGHVHLLAAAAALGDVLIVAVDSDASVRRLKGEHRPIITEDQRVAIIGALDAVDAVVTFDSDDLEALIEEIAPDVLVKGSDYRVDEVVGAKSVLDRGGSVRLIPLLDGMSTSALLGRIRGD